MKLGLIFFVVAAAAVLAVRFLPWWAVLGAILALILAGVLFGGRIVAALFKMPFRAKGAVLRGATAEIHSITPTAKVQGGEDDEADAGRRYYLLDVTIRPLARTGNAFQLWEPSGLALVAPDAKGEDTDSDGDLCDIRKIEIETETKGKFADDEGMKFGGPQRLRLTLAVAPGAHRFQFRYYFELFGSASFPA